MSFAWLHKAKTWRKSKNMWYGYRWLYSLYKNKDIYSDIAKDVQTRFDTCNYELDR